MPGRIAYRRLRRKPKAAGVQVGERVRVELRGRSALLVPLLEQRKLREQDDRLDRVESGGVADVVVLVLLRLAVHPKRGRVLGQRVLVSHEGAGISHRAKVLRGIKAEG